VHYLSVESMKDLTWHILIL